jgi:hypothetical protein
MTSVFTRRRRREHPFLVLFVLLPILFTGIWIVCGWWWMLFAGFLHSEVSDVVAPFGIWTGMKMSLFFMIPAIIGAVFKNKD